FYPNALINPSSSHPRQSLYHWFQIMLLHPLFQFCFQNRLFYPSYFFSLIRHTCFKKHSLITPSQPLAGIICPSGSFFVLLLFILKKDPDILVRKFITSNDHLFPQHFIDKIKKQCVINHNRCQRQKLLGGYIPLLKNWIKTFIHGLNPG